MFDKSQNKIRNYSKELVEMGERDQKMRFDSQNPELNITFDKKIDKENKEKLQKIIKKIGWPTIAKVGEEASYAAWLVVQHADHDIAFQEECLKLMLESKEDVLPGNIAYLMDRVAVNKGELQIYGTQFYRNEDGQIIPRPIKDIKNLNSRRKEMGLEGFSVYRDKMIGEYRYAEEYKNPKIGRFFKST
jgi:hypothetical protein